MARGPGYTVVVPEAEAKKLDAQRKAEPSTAQKIGEGVYDVGKSIVTGVVQGVAGLPGLPADLLSTGQELTEAGVRGITGEPKEVMDARIAAQNGMRPKDFAPAGGAAFREDVANAVPALRPTLEFEGETGPGRVAGAVAEAVPGAVVPGVIVRAFHYLAGGGQLMALEPGVRAEVMRMAGDAVRQGAIPALTAQVGGEIAKQSGASPDTQRLAEILSGIGGSVVGGVGGTRGGGAAKVGEAIGDTAEAGQRAVQNVEAMGQTGMVMDASPQTSARAAALAAIPGRAMDTVTRAVEERLATRGPRMRQAIDDELGQQPPNYADETQMARAQRANRGEQAYTEARQNSGPVDLTRVTAHLDSESGPYGRNTGLNDIEREARSLRQELSGRTSIEDLHRTRSNLSSRLNDERNPPAPAVARVLRGALERLDDALDEASVRRDAHGNPVMEPDPANPGRQRPASAYRDARNAWAEDSEYLRMRERGQNLISGGKNVRPDELAQDLRTMSDLGRRGLVEGMRDDLNAIMDATRHEATAGIRNIDTGRARQILHLLEAHQVVQPGAAERLTQMVQGQAREATTATRVIGGSQTGMREAGKEAFANPESRGVPDLPSTGVGYANLLLQPLYKTYQRTVNATNNAEAARILTSGQNLSTAERTVLIRQLQEAYQQGGYANVPKSLQAAIAGSIGPREEPIKKGPR